MSLIPSYWAILFWLIVSIGFALAPLLISFLMIVVDKDIDAGWTELLKDGELFFFSTAISAASLYSAMDKLLIIIDAKSGLNNNVIVIVFVAFCAICLLFISTTYSTVLIYLKLKQPDQAPKITTILFSDNAYRNITITSMIVALASSFVNLIVNIFL